MEIGEGGGAGGEEKSEAASLGGIRRAGSLEEQTPILASLRSSLLKLKKMKWKIFWAWAKLLRKLAWPSGRDQRVSFALA